MVPWIQVYSNFVLHPKTYKLADLLGLRSQQVQPHLIAAGMMVGIWSWAVQNAPDGDLTACTDQCIADAAGWRQSPKKLMDALIESGYVDRTENGKTLHDWEDYAALLMEQVDNRKAKTKERVKRYRERKKTAAGDGDNGDCNSNGGECNGYCNVTDTPCNASTIPDITIHNSVGSSGKPSEPTQKSSSSSCADTREEGAGVHCPPPEDGLKAVMTRYMNDVNCQPSRGCAEDLMFYTQQLGSELVLHAIDIAVDNNKRQWDYIKGILQNYLSAGFKTMAQVQTNEQQRAAAKAAKAKAAEEKRKGFAALPSAPPPQTGPKVSEAERLREISKLIHDEGR